MPKFGNFTFLGLKINQNPVQENPFGPKISSKSTIFVQKKKKRSVQQAIKFGAN